MATVKLSHIDKFYDNHYHAVKDLNLTIPSGAFAALLGPSGCGKTTILRMLAGLENISNGALYLDERLLADSTLHTAPENRDMSMVFQSYALWPHMTVAENVGYPLKIAKVKGAALTQKVKAVLDVVELGAYAARSPQELSGGQRQRVALARCLVSNPKVVLLDEPLANLDRHLRATMEETFREFHRRTGATFVYVTHDQAEAMALATHIAVLDQGHLMQWGKPDELYREPKNRWVASFIGQGSVLELAINRQTFLVDNARYLSGNQLLNAWPDSELTERAQVFIRPQHVHLVEEGIAVKVISSIYQGERYLVTLQLQDRAMNGATLLAYHPTPLMLGSVVKIRLQQGWLLDE